MADGDPGPDANLRIHRRWEGAGSCLRPPHGTQPNTPLSGPQAGTRGAPAPGRRHRRLPRGGALVGPRILANLFPGRQAPWCRSSAEGTGNSPSTAGSTWGFPAPFVNICKYVSRGPGSGHCYCYCCHFCMNGARRGGGSLPLGSRQAGLLPPTPSPALLAGRTQKAWRHSSQGVEVGTRVFWKCTNTVLCSPQAPPPIP